MFVEMREGCMRVVIRLCFPVWSGVERHRSSLTGSSRVSGSVRRNGGGGDRERALAPAFRADKAGTADVDGGDT